MAGGQAALIGLLAGRLFYLGGIRSRHYETLALENRIRLRLILPARGRLFDRNGVVLSENVTNYRLICYPGESRNLEDIVRAFFSLSFISSDSLKPETLLQALKRHPRFQPYVLKENLSWENVCEVEVRAAHLKPLQVEKGTKRFYPQGSTFAHLVGYVQSPSPEDRASKKLFQLPDYRIGKKGVEIFFEESLQGTTGFREVEVNARGQLVRELTKKPATQGRDHTLSLEAALQKKGQDLLQHHKSGSLVVMDIFSGEILALVSTPSFDPNLFIDGISHKDWSALRDNPYAPLSNKGVQGLYSPGSLFKMVVALAGLKAGIVDPYKTVKCTGYVEISGHRYHCWRRFGHGALALKGALRESCDVYYYDLARRVGIDRIQAMAYELGLGHPTGLELIGEKKGLIPGREWKKKTHKRPWTLGDTVLSSIGQGAMLATPLQLTVMMARLVGQGKAIVPTLQKRSQGTFSFLNILPAHLALIKEAMDSTVNSPAGTAFKYRIKDPGFEMGGKSATTQVRRISLKERQKRVLRNEELPWKMRDHALFGGYAPLHAPRFVSCVVIDHGGSGSRTAGPLVRDLLLYAQRLQGLT